MKAVPRTTIITIGDEILIGQITDTNSGYMAAELNKIGIAVQEMCSISDNRSEILDTLQRVTSSENPSLVLITGGLGPTNDDITKKVLAEFTGAKGMHVHEPSLEMVRNITQRRGMLMNELNRNQALVPDSCTVLLNTCGTAPGMWFEYGNAMIVSMPGVPFEMQAMMPEVLQRLQKHYNLPPVYHRSIKTFGIGEAVLAETIAAWENELPPHIKLAYLPNPLTGVCLRLSVYDTDVNTAAEVSREIERLQAILGKAVYGEGADTLESVVGMLLKEKGATLATAESCTGGKIASMITSVPGSSAYFKGSIIAYDNAVKTVLLGVHSATLAQYGAVSLQVVEQMALGACNRMHTDYAVATSGIAGPAGGTPEKPVGTVCIAIATPHGVKSQTFQFTNDRMRNIDRSAAHALNMLRLELLK